MLFVVLSVGEVFKSEIVVKVYVVVSKIVVYEAVFLAVLVGEVVFVLVFVDGIALFISIVVGDVVIISLCCCRSASFSHIADLRS